MKFRKRETARTPWLRQLFGNGTDEARRTADLYDHVRDMFSRSPLSRPGASDRVALDVLHRVEQQAKIPDALRDRFHKTIHGILGQEDVAFALPKLDYETATLKQRMLWRQFLRQKRDFLARGQPAELMVDTLAQVMVRVAWNLPKGSATASPFTSELPFTDPRALTGSVIKLLSNEALDRYGLYSALRRQVYLNICQISGIVPGAETKRPPVMPADCKLPDEAILRAYLGDTAISSLLDVRLPFSLPSRIFGEHGAILAGTGHGKTETQKALIISWLKESDPPGMIVIDNTGALLNSMGRLAVFNTTLKDRIIIIDPPDEPPLNFMDFDTADSGAQQAFGYLMKALDATLSPRQGAALAAVLALCKKLPGSSINTLRKIMELPKPTPEIEKVVMTLDEYSRDFLLHQFWRGNTFNPTKTAIATRCYALLQKPKLVAMFTAKHNCFRALKFLQEKKIVIVNTSSKHLGEDASLLGRFIIAQLLAVVEHRPENDRPLCIAVIDEARFYFDQSTIDILVGTRQFGLGLCFSTQQLSQMHPDVKSAALGNTAVKLAGGNLSHMDASRLALEMHTTTDAIRKARKIDRVETNWMFYGPHALTPNNAIQLTVPFRVMEKEPQMTEDEYQALRARNRAMLHADPGQAQPTPTAQPGPGPERPPLKPVPDIGDPSEASEY